LIGPGRRPGGGSGAAGQCVELARLVEGVQVLAQVLSIVAPNYLLAFARAAITDLVSRGGFPPFLLPLVTFEALHAHAQQQKQAAGQPAAGTVN